MAPVPVAKELSGGRRREHTNLWEVSAGLLIDFDLQKQTDFSICHIMLTIFGCE